MPHQQCHDANNGNQRGRENLRFPFVFDCLPTLSLGRSSPQILAEQFFGDFPNYHICFISYRFWRESADWVRYYNQRQASHFVCFSYTLSKADKTVSSHGHRWDPCLLYSRRVEDTPRRAASSIRYAYYNCIASVGDKVVTE